MIDFHGTWTVQNYGVAAGLVVVGLIGLYIAWKLTKSAVKLIFWFALLILLLAAAGWLLEKGGFLPH